MQETRPSLSYEFFRDTFVKLDAQKQAGFFLWPSLASHTLTAEEKELLLKIQPSGVVLFKRNFSDLEQGKAFIQEIRECCTKKNTIFEKNFIISADEEGGRVSRLPLGVKTKPVLEFSRNHDKQGLTHQILLQTKIAKDLGVNCIFAPVLDIFTEPSNTVIGDRSFGNTPEQVCEYASIVYNILEQNHIFSCAKHFPGHGNTKTDSHVDFAFSDVTKEVLEKREWIPFVHFISKNIPMIMAAHVILPNLGMDPAIKQRDDNYNPRDKNENLPNENENSPNQNDIPATLNHHILTQILRNELRFEGLILSDDLRMGAIKKFYEKKGIKDDYLAYACIDALLAGCDILLSCHSIFEEKIIIDSIAEKMQKENVFFDLCCEKAYRQTLLLFSHFENVK